MTESDSSWPASADLIAQLKTAIGQRDLERDPFVRQALVIRVSDLQYRLAELNSAETARLEARTSPLADAWLDQVARQAEVAVGIRDHGSGLSSQQVRDRDGARVACVLAVPALLAEIRRLRQEQERQEQALLRARASQPLDACECPEPVTCPYCSRMYPCDCAGCPSKAVTRG